MLTSIMFEWDKVICEMQQVDYIWDLCYDYTEYNIDTPIVDILQKHCNHLIQDIRDHVAFWTICKGTIVHNTLFDQLFR